MTSQSIYEFVEARISESERATEGLRLETIEHLRLMFLSMRCVLEMHKQWPIMVTSPIEIEPVDPHATMPGPMNSIVYRASKNIDFLIYSAYVERFGEEPPTTLMLRQIATIWEHHPDFQREWSLTNPEFYSALGYDNG